MPDIPIRIHHDGEGRLVCDPWIAEAETGDEIVWSCAYPFAIHFHERSPLQRLRYYFKTLVLDPISESKKLPPGYFFPFPKVGFTLRAPVIYDPAGRGPRKFHYYVSCFNGRFVEIIDPDLVIPPRDGRGGSG